MAEYVAVLRAAIAGIAGRDAFTVEQIDDLRMAVEEAAAQLLRRSTGQLTMAVTPDDEGLAIRIAANVDGADPVVDETSFSWMILSALADHVTTEPGEPYVFALHKRRLPPDSEG
jgi:serine/threonine-protein kinase RsbW